MGARSDGAIAVGGALVRLYLRVLATEGETTMKTIVGTSYVTEMQYNGILSSLPVTTDENTIGNITKNK